MTVAARRQVAEIFWAFLSLGMTSFGGPIAHLGYFRAELVQRRRWLSEADYADLVALCQFLPGPTSSQVGFALGLQRGGLPGALAAWTAFTLPSAALLVLLALSAAAMTGPVAQGLVHGLKLVAVAVVAHAVWGMTRSLCPDRWRAAIALGALWLVVSVPAALGQVAAIVLGGLGGLLLGSPLANVEVGRPRGGLSRCAGAFCLLAFVLLLLGLPVLAGALDWPGLAVFEAFYRAGALVFGGGHVVLPLLEASTVASGWVSADEFLAGYGAAQAVPGPLFTFAAFLGALSQPGPGGWAGAALCLVAVFLPGLLLVLGVLPFWDRLRARRRIQRIMAGANAAVVGILAAALYQPVWTSAIDGARDFAVASTAFLLLSVWRVAPWRVVLVTALAGLALNLAAA